MAVNTSNRVNIARYEAWRRRKKRRKIFKGIARVVLILVIVGGVAVMVRSFDRDIDDDYLVSSVTYTETTPNTNVENPNTEIEDENSDESDEVIDDAFLVDDDQTQAPVVFCGSANPDNATVISNDEAMSYLALINNCYRMSSDFSPNDLSVVNVPSVNPPFGSNDHQLRETAARATEALFAEAAANGLFLLMSSGYRDYNSQVFFHNNAINDWGLVEARRRSAVPGHSEHQLGLAVDLTTHELGGLLKQIFTETTEGMWVGQNAHRFGFILSFPYGREEDTGIMYEPWHIRYVGIAAATEMFNAGLILEEFLWYSE